MKGLQLRPQEEPYDAEESCYFFAPTEDIPFSIDCGAREQFGQAAILACLSEIQALAVKHNGLDRLQIFESADHEERLWIIEASDGEMINALLPMDD